MTQSSLQIHDVLILGAGVVGCAVARAFALEGADVAIVDRAADILEGASKGNSALLHTGFDAPKGSLELECVRAGYRRYLEIRARLNLPLVESSALVVAWTDDELEKLPTIVRKAHDNGVPHVRPVEAEELRRLEPSLAEDAMGAVLVPGEHVIDPWSAPLAYITQACANGATLSLGCEVTGGALEGDHWRIETSEGPRHARVVVNCAGLYGDIVEAIARESPFRIRPRKGQFVVLDKPAAALVRHILLPVPNERTKGVLVARTAFGNVLAGPTAEDQEDREHAGVEESHLRDLVRRAQRMVPALSDIGVNATYAGLRPATETRDYIIEAQPERRWITVAGIRSTGLTGALGIGDYVLDLHESHFPTLPGRAPEAIAWPTVPNISEYGRRGWQEPDCGEIVCHCELVTRKEIEAALASAVPARTIGGLRRRTRCMLGRCQGFYCSGAVAELAGARLAPTLSVGRAA